MLFDLTGKRKHVVRVVYAILALLMGASLFLVIGPFNIAEIVDSGSSTSTLESYEDQAERTEKRLASAPNDEQLLLSLTRTRILAGRSLVEVDPETGAPVVPPEAREQFESGFQAWSKYLKNVKDDPSPFVAGFTAEAFFNLAASGGTSVAEIEENLERAVAAQRLAAEGKPSPNSLFLLAQYEYFNGNFAAGDKATKEVLKEAPSAKEQLTQIRKAAKQWEKQKKKLAKEQKKRGPEELQGGSFSGFGGIPISP